MPHDFVYKIEEWATDGIKSAPSENLKKSGFTAGMVPPAYVFNYQWDLWSNAITELQEYAPASVDALKSVSATVTIGTSQWVDNVYTYSNAEITATCPIELLPAENITAEEFKALQRANIIGGTQTKGSVKLKAMGTVPSVAIPVKFIIRRDM